MKIQGRILCSIQDLNLAAVLKSGQCFRWNEALPGEWVGPLGSRLWILQQDELGIDFTVMSEKSEKSWNEDRAEKFLEDYLQMNVPLKDLYSDWSKKDAVFREIAKKLPGVRVLRQDPVENLFSFICATNNNISRITSMVEDMCKNYGSTVGEYAGNTYYSFPSLMILAGEGVESTLRALRFGYRAGYIRKAAQQVLDQGGEAWLHGLRSRPYQECHSELRALCGVGPKVADCVSLMSMDQPSAVPVDIHMLRVARRHYMPQMREVKTLTDKAYGEVANRFREIFGDYAGWAQAVLFYDDLGGQKPPKATPETKENAGQARKRQKRTNASNSSIGVGLNSNISENTTEKVEVSRKRQGRKRPVAN